MKKVLITGASGMVGGIVLNKCLNDESIGEVVSIVRRPMSISDKKYHEIVHDHFLDYSSIEAAFEHVDVCYFCIGVYTGQVSKEKFTEITVDYTREFAEALYKQSPNAAFVFLSGQGADSKEKSRILFARTKGIAENHLLGLGFGRVHIFRPGYIYPVTPRKEPNFSYRISRWLYKPLSAIYPNIGLTSEKLAHRMYEIGLNGGELEIYENRDIRNG